MNEPKCKASLKLGGINPESSGIFYPQEELGFPLLSPWQKSRVLKPVQLLPSEALTI